MTISGIAPSKVFRRARAGRESTEEYRNAVPVLVTLEELQDHSLLMLRAAGQTLDESVDALANNWFAKSEAGLRWLSEKLAANNRD